MPKYLLAIDQGTTSTRAIVFDARNKIVSQQQIPLQQYFPQNGWVEHDPEEIWQAVLLTCRQALQQANLAASQIAAIGITNQRETTIIWDKKTGKPIYHAIVWQDRRTAEFCQSIANDAAMIKQRTGLLPDPYFSASKIRWVLNEVSGAREKAARGELLFGTIDSFILWRLTAGKTHATDATNASRTSLFNIQTQTWDDELLRLFDIPRRILPQVLDNCADFGSAQAELLGAAIPIVAMAGDQQAALVGQACFQPGDIKSTYGTGAFLLLNTGNKIVTSQHKLLTALAYRLKGIPTYAIEGSIFAAGSIMQWLRDNLGLLRNAADSENAASLVMDNGGVYLVPAFTGLGAPYWEPNARGAIFGLTRETRREHIIRAGLEAIAYQTEDLLQAMLQDGAVMPASLRVDGGMASNNWLLQFLADILQVPVVRPEIIETTALGVAYLAGLQIGWYSSLAEIAVLWKMDRRFEPNMDEKTRRILYENWEKAVRKT